VNALPLIMLAVLAGGFWFLVLRPAKARQAAQQKLVNHLEIGARVMTTAGMFGYVRAVSDEEVALEIADGIIIQMLKPAISKVAPLKLEAVTDLTVGGSGRESAANDTVTLTSDDAVIDVSNPK
jgi:preprotein translocase subunit YajC